MSFKSLNKYLLCPLFFASVIACSDSGQALTSDFINNPSGGGGEDPDRQPLSSIPEICSTLDFNGVTWPNDYEFDDQVAFSLAMNITGSFEGHNGWTNLSNNFDGQGFSMGILNQNLGQGTIQPLLIRIRDNHRHVFADNMTQAMLDSMLGMLSDWESSLVATSNDAPIVEPERQLIDFAQGDVDKKYASVALQTRSNSASVRWAKKTLYQDSRGRNFKPEWRKALKAIAGDPAYISLQIEAAQYIHDRALSYKDRLQWDQLRSYLFLFDIVTQNGSLREKHFDKYFDWLAEQSRVTEEEKMLEMLEIRVVDSNPKWQEDVRRRKTAIILGTGFVHGENRNLPVEYCYDPVIPYTP